MTINSYLGVEVCEPQFVLVSAMWNEPAGWLAKPYGIIHLRAEMEYCLRRNGPKFTLTIAWILLAHRWPSLDFTSTMRTGMPSTCLLSVFQGPNTTAIPNPLRSHGYIYRMGHLRTSSERVLRLCLITAESIRT